MGRQRKRLLGCEVKDMLQLCSLAGKQVRPSLRAEPHAHSKYCHGQARVLQSSLAGPPIWLKPPSLVSIGPLNLWAGSLNRWSGMGAAT
eukprot:1160971-Pelagomonas_calceolata.AAC.14